MKKLLTFLCSVGLLLSMSACSSGNKVDDKALDALEKGINKIVEMKTASYTITMDATAGEKSSIMKLYGGYLADTAKPSFTATLDLESQGSKLDGFMKVFLKDDDVYLEMLGSKQKMPLEDDETTDMLPIDLDKFQNYKVDKKEIKPFLKKASISNDTLNLELDPDKMNKAIQKQSTDALPRDDTYKKFNVVATIKDDFLTKIVLDFEGTQKDATTSEDQKVVGTITIEFTDINTKKALIFPDLSQFTESES